MQGSGRLVANGACHVPIAARNRSQRRSRNRTRSDSARWWRHHKEQTSGQQQIKKEELEEQEVEMQKSEK